MRPGSMPLAKVFQVKGVCEDCGWRTVKGRREIATEQLRHQIATPEELGSLMTCPHCLDRGTNGKNITIRVIDAAGISTPLRMDRRSLSAIDLAFASCPDCGETYRFERKKLDALAAEAPSVDALWRTSFCGTCAAAGAQRKMLTLEVFPPMPEPKDSPKPKWSKATVFGENRSDPFFRLPRRRIAQ